MKKINLPHDKNFVTYKSVTFIISLLYSFFLIYFIPMDDILDRANYLNYATNSEVLFFKYLSGGALKAVTNEPIWLFINTVLNYFFTSYDTVYVIIVFSAATSSYVILNYNPKFIFFLLLLLLFPQVIGKYIVHLRQGLAISFFLLGYFSSSKLWRYSLYALTPFIHSSFFFILLLITITATLKKIYLSFSIINIFIVFIGICLSVNLKHITHTIGARQVNEYSFSSDEVSGLGFMFWSFVFLLYFLEGKAFIKKHPLSLISISFYLATYFFLEISGRIFESIIIIVLLTGLNLTNWRKRLFIIILVFYIVYYWTTNFNKPWFGWGVSYK